MKPARTKAVFARIPEEIYLALNKKIANEKPETTVSAIMRSLIDLYLSDRIDFKSGESK